MTAATGPGDCRLPCGCLLETVEIDGVPTLIMTACSPDCKYVRYVADETDKAGKRLVEIGGRIDRRA